MDVIQRAAIMRLVGALRPWDAIEADHQAIVLRWMRSGAALYRIGPPATPSMHLASYFLPYDARRSTVMLVAHRKAGLELPPGGHCEPGESPWDTVRRECVEELGVPATPLEGVGTAPLFVTVTQTRPPHRHTDVSLWHLIGLSQEDPGLRLDPAEFRVARWMQLDDLLGEPIERLDPHMHRFARKMCAAVRRTGTNLAG